MTEARAEQVSLRDVVGHAVALLRPHAALHAALAMVLVVLPELFAERVADGIESALIPTDRDAATGAVRFAVDLLGVILPTGSGLLLDVAVVLIALRDGSHLERPAPSVASIAVRVVPPAMAAFSAALAWLFFAPAVAFVTGSAVISLWILVLPLAAAEAVPVSTLPRRALALARGRGGIISRLLACYLVIYVALGEIDIAVADPFQTGTLGSWTIDIVETSLVAALAVLADAASVALYLALRRSEAARSSRDLATAFD